MLRSNLKCSAILSIAFILASPLSAEAKGKAYGDGVKLRVATPIEKLLASPAKWVGKDVRVDGVATNVCAKMGCWIELSDEKTGKGIRFKVEDGVIVFPLTAKGRKASAEGTFEEVIVSPEERKKHEKEHKADKAHGEHDSHAEGPTYQIRATGAVIY